MEETGSGQMTFNNIRAVKPTHVIIVKEKVYMTWIRPSISCSPMKFQGDKSKLNLKMFFFLLFTTLDIMFLCKRMQNKMARIELNAIVQHFLRIGNFWQVIRLIGDATIKKPLWNSRHGLFPVACKLHRFQNCKSDENVGWTGFHHKQKS